MSEWRKTAKTIVVTATVTSVVWISVGAILIQRARMGGEPAVAEAPLRVGRLVIPVAGVLPSQLSDTFKQAREGGQRVHDAIDIMAARGTPVLAAAAGTVEKVFVSEPGGKTVYVRSPDKTLLYYYAHLDQYAPGLAEGQALRAGQPIGTVGYTGNANPAAPHLHFSVQRTKPGAKWHDPATPLNPYPLIVGR